MNLNETREKAIGEIERFSLANETTPLVITFAEGDSYVCHCDTGEWEDNGEWSSGRMRETCLATRNGTRSACWS